MADALRAAKVALIAVACLTAFVSVLVALYAAALWLFGGWGAAGLYLLTVFGILWLCALADLRCRP